MIYPPVSVIILFMRSKQGVSWYDFKGGAMTTFYYETWLPFVFTKKRILFLAIASYIALC